MTLTYITYEDQQAVVAGSLTLPAAQERALERLAAERDGLRNALERIVRVCGWDDHDGELAVQIAQEALGD